MKINEISLINFRNHHKTVIAGLSKINYFLGYNGAGKSTILDAIQYALTGTARGTTDGGQGSECLKSEIKGGPKAAAMVKMLTSAGEVVRGVGQGPKSQAHFNIQQMLGLDSRFLRIVAAPMNILRLERKKQEEVFFALTGSVVSKADVEKALIEAGVTDAAEVADNALTPAGREFYMAHLKKRRPEIKQEIAGLVYVPMEGAVKADEIKRKRLESEVKALGDKIAQAQRSQDAAGSDRRHLNETLASREQKLAELRAQAQVDERLSPEAIEFIKKSLTTHEELCGQRDSAMTRRNTALGKMGEIRVKGESIKKLGPVCGTCSQKIDESYTKQALDDSRKAYVAAEKENKAAQLEIDGLQAKINAINTTELREKLSRHERADAKASLLEGQIQSAQDEIEEVRVKIGNLPEEGKTFSIEGDVMASKAAKEQEIAKLLEAEREGGKMLHINQTRSAKERELEEIERIIEAIGPGGPVAQLMTSGGVEEVVEMVRENAQRLGVGDVGISFNPWQITLNGRNIELASGSEEWRVAAAFGIAFAKKAQASIVCLDGADILRGANRDKFAELVEDSGLEQVFVAGAVDDLPEDGASVEGISVYRVEANVGGVAVVTRLGQGVAA